MFHCKGATKRCMARHVFNTNSYANINILVYKFVAAGLSRFSYHCKNSCWQPSKIRARADVMGVYFVVAQFERLFSRGHCLPNC